MTRRFRHIRDHYLAYSLLVICVLIGIIIGELAVRCSPQIVVRPYPVVVNPPPAPPAPAPVKPPHRPPRPPRPHVVPPSIQAP